MDVLEIDAGLWRWTAYHEEWKEDVGCTFVATEDGVVLIDPLVPADDTARFWKALDRDVKRAKGRVHVLVTVFWHTRSAATMRERYDARIWAPSGGKAAIARRAGVVTDPFAIGDELPGGIEACRTARAAEVVYWIPEHSALVPGDVLLGDGKGGAKMCPESWLPDEQDSPRPRSVASTAARPPRTSHPRLARQARRHGRRAGARARTRDLAPIPIRLVWPRLRKRAVFGSLRGFRGTNRRLSNTGARRPATSSATIRRSALSFSPVRVDNG